MTEKRRQRRFINRKSIWWRMLGIMLVAVTIQFLLLYGTIYWGGIMSALQKNACDILDSTVTRRENSLEDDMVQRWSFLSNTVDGVNAKVSDFLVQNNVSYGDLQVSSDLTTELLGNLSEDMIYILRRNTVTGAFLLFNGKNETTPPIGDEVQRRAGIYFRDFDPNTNVSDDSDLMIERAPSTLTKQLGITTDSFWRPYFSFQADTKDDYFFKPFSAALAHPGADVTDLGYWSPVFHLENDTLDIITYTLPLLSEDGIPYGVMGVELSLNHLVKQLPYSEFNENKEGSYLLAVSQDNGNTFENVAASGPYFTRLFGQDKTITLSGRKLSDDIFSIEHGDRVSDEVYGCVKYLQLYNANTPFENERWALIGIMEEKTLFSFAQNMQAKLNLALAVSFAVGTLSVFLVSIAATKPIRRLAKQLKENDTESPVALQKIGVSEIDDLSNAIETLSERVADSASRLSQIVQLMDYRIGAYEALRDTNEVYLTDGYFSLIGREDYAGVRHMPFDKFREIMGQLEEVRDDSAVNPNQKIYCVSGKEGVRWLMLKFSHTEEKGLGVISDITSDYIERKKIEFERDYDLLTNLLNRRAFHQQVSQLFDTGGLSKIAAMVMLDLDNLKYINDTYGHDCGDAYICGAADVLKRFTSEKLLAARMSGDEFYLFVQGASSEEVEAQIRKIEESFAESFIRLSDGQLFRIRVSAGVAWYPADASEFERLIKYADFAMYRVKHTAKGKFAQFNMSSYEREGYLLQKKEELNKLIDGELVDYYFQPIVSAEDGSIHAYEALMRPMLDSLQSPLDVLNLARSQSKLNEIERITLDKSLKKFSSLSPVGDTFKIFVNSIANQIVSEEEMARLEQKYEPYLSRLVIEMTEEEQQIDEITHRKQAFARKWGASVALDDFGVGYNSESLLLSLGPNYIKIDKIIIRDIDKDDSRLQIFCNLMTYAKEQGIKVIAEGVESREEMEVLIRHDVDYLQGFYLGYPTKELSEVPQQIVEQIREARKELDR